MVFEGQTLCVHRFTSLVNSFIKPLLIVLENMDYAFVKLSFVFYCWEERRNLKNITSWGPKNQSFREETPAK